MGTFSWDGMEQDFDAAEFPIYSQDLEFPAHLQRSRMGAFASWIAQVTQAAPQTAQVPSPRRGLQHSPCAVVWNRG